MKKFIIVMLFLLSACATKNVTEKEVGVYIIDHYDPLGGPASNAKCLGFMAKKVCPSGYTKLKEWAKPHPENNMIYYWEIRCLG
jgi:hypothetical protein